MPTSAVAQLRYDRGLTQEDLAERAGVSLKTVKRAEAGAALSPRSWRRIADALDVPIESLVSAGRDMRHAGPVEAIVITAQELRRGRLIARWLTISMTAAILLTTLTFAASVALSKAPGPIRPAVADRMGVPMSAIHVSRATFRPVPFVVFADADVVVQTTSGRQSAVIRLMHLPLFDHWVVRDLIVQT